VAVVSEAFANRAWRGRNPIGQQLRFLNDGAVGLWRTVVGVAADTKYHDFLSERPEVYIPLYQSEPGTFIAVRSTGNPMDVVPLARDALRVLDQGYGIAKAVSAEQLLESRLARPKFLAATVVVLAETVAILAAIGLFGVLSFTISQRRREFGIRLAHGATAAHLRSLVFQSVIRLTMIGAALGFAIGVPAADILRHEIVGISTFDSLSLTAALVVLLATVALAAALPVARATNVDPVSAIRE
jgi:putative ABC transport system permease protein